MPARRLKILLAITAIAAAGVVASWALRSSSGGAEVSAQPAQATADACRPIRGDHRLGTAFLHVPPRYRAPLPLVVAFHGARGNGLGFAKETGLSKSANAHGFAVLYPTAGSSRHFWSLNRQASPDDVAALRALLPRVEALVCADPRRVYATGVSNGGGFAARVGCEMADVFAAVAPVAGGYSSLDPCPDGVHQNVLEIHGSDDQIVPYEGRGADRAGDVRTYVAEWARRDGCDAKPQIRPGGHDVTWVRHRHCDPGYTVTHVRLEGTDHGWPGAKPPWPRRSPSGIVARELVWSFFQDKRLHEPHAAAAPSPG